jgi:Protein of unknown function (DUF3754)
MIKYFRNITIGDLYMLLPEVRVVMSFTDRVTIGVPAVAGAVPLLLNLLPALTVLGLVAGYLLGLVPEVDSLRLGLVLLGRRDSLLPAPALWVSEPPADHVEDWREDQAERRDADHAKEYGRT